MSKDRIVRMSGWALMIGAVAFFPWLIMTVLEEFGYQRSGILGPGIREFVVVVGFVAGPLLFPIGLLRMLVRVQRKN